jgi:hypothetical protein
VLAAPLRKLNNGSGKHAVGIVGQVQAGKSFSVPGGRERLVPGAGDEERVSGAEPQVVLIPYVTVSLVIPCKGAISNRWLFSRRRVYLWVSFVI